MPTSATPAAVIPATCLIMAGGRSTRFGSDKLAASVSGRTPLLAYTLARVAPWFAETVVVHGQGGPPPGLERGPGAQPPPVRFAADYLPGGGPLVGLISGLSACRTEWAFVLAADMPFVERALVDLLWKYASETDDADVVVPVTPRGIEPLCAFYRRSVKGAARTAADARKRRVIAFFDEVRVVEIAEADSRSVDPELVSFFNINTVEDLQAAQRTAAAKRQAAPDGRKARPPLQGPGPSERR